MTRARGLIEILGMQPHPEGGHYVEIHRSRGQVRPADPRGDRPALTTIYFLLGAGEISRWHRVRGSDEVWAFQEGSPLALYTAGRDFEHVERRVLGPVERDRRPIHVVEAGVWQAAESLGDYTLVSCVVGPGFDFADFDMLRDVPEAKARAGAVQPGAMRFL